MKDTDTPNPKDYRDKYRTGPPKKLRNSGEMSFTQAFDPTPFLPEGLKKCEFCGKPATECNPLEAMIFDDRLICSAACLQKELNSKPTVFEFPDGSKMEIPPGCLIVESKPGFPVYEGECPSQQITIEVEEEGTSEEIPSGFNAPVTFEINGGEDT